MLARYEGDTVFFSDEAIISRWIKKLQTFVCFPLQQRGVCPSCVSVRVLRSLLQKAGVNTMRGTGVEVRSHLEHCSPVAFRSSQVRMATRKHDEKALYNIHSLRLVLFSARWHQWMHTRAAKRRRASGHRFGFSGRGGGCTWRSYRVAIGPTYARRSQAKPLRTDGRACDG